MTIPDAPPPLLRATGITKRFGSVTANQSVDFDVHAGEIHALLGENGAGKSTLLSIIGGLYRPESGTLEIDGTPVSFTEPADALAHGIGAVHQHFTLALELSVLENVALGLGSRIRLDLDGVRERAMPVLTRLGLHARVDDQVRQLSLGERQRLEIAKALVRGSRLLLLDEPTSILSPGEVDGLFAILRGLALEGTAIVIVTHKLDEAIAISHRITILRRGMVSGTLSREEVQNDDPEAITARIVADMFATDLPAHAGFSRSAPGELRLRIDRMSANDDRGAVALRECSIGLKSGEITGLAGVDGNGQRELVEAIAGLRAITTGVISFDGRDIARLGIAERRALGIICLTEDRLGEGSVADLSVAENLMLTRAPGRFWLDRRAMVREAEQLIAEWEISAPGPGSRAGDLSGGNIQKLILARELSQRPKVLIANKPTHGLDARTSALIRSRLREQANAGCAVLLIESDLDDLLPVSDRIIVLAHGRIAGEFPRNRLDVAMIGRLMAGAA
jgi:simple sugar transport system ATP-binding protein